MDMICWFLARTQSALHAEVKSLRWTLSDFSICPMWIIVGTARWHRAAVPEVKHYPQLASVAENSCLRTNLAADNQRSSDCLSVLCGALSSPLISESTLSHCAAASPKTLTERELRCHIWDDQEEKKKQKRQTTHWSSPVNAEATAESISAFCMRVFHPACTCGYIVMYSVDYMKHVFKWSR